MGKKPLFLGSTEGMTVDDVQSAVRAALRSLLPQEPAEGSSLEESPAEELDEGEG